jgi:hypothetical protein
MISIHTARGGIAYLGLLVLLAPTSTYGDGMNAARENMLQAIRDSVAQSADYTRGICA